VGPRENLRTRTIAVDGINWLAPAEPRDCLVKVRSTRAGVAARVTPGDGGGATVAIAGGEEGVAPGQACVFYAEDGSRVLGGGWIAAAKSAPAAQPAKAAAPALG
jgi:tRNA-specific 2-thiouridylase